MSLIQRIIGAGLRPHVRRKARGASLEDLTIRLEASMAQVLQPRMERAADTSANRETLNHWVGIERWSLSRVRVAQGDQFLEGSYHPFREPEDAAFQDLKSAFVQARAQTLALAREFQRSGFDPELTIPHNHLGALSVTEWFAYIEDHSRREAIRLR